MTFYRPPGGIDLQARTPGIRRALKKLAERKRANRNRVERGEKPILQDPKTGENKQVSLKTYYARTGVKHIPVKKGKK